jgi:hypothetical protein
VCSDAGFGAGWRRWVGGPLHIGGVVRLVDDELGGGGPGRAMHNCQGGADANLQPVHCVSSGCVNSTCAAATVSGEPPAKVTSHLCGCSSAAAWKPRGGSGSSCTFTPRLAPLWDLWACTVLGAHEATAQQVGNGGGCAALRPVWCAAADVPGVRLGGVLPQRARRAGMAAGCQPGMPGEPLLLTALLRCDWRPLLRCAVHLCAASTAARHAR